MSEPENLTPAHLRCDDTLTCPSIHRLEDGRLQIVGSAAKTRKAQYVDDCGVVHFQDWTINGAQIVGDDEAAVIISPDLLDSLKAEWVREARIAENNDLNSFIIQTRAALSPTQEKGE